MKPSYATKIRYRTLIFPLLASALLLSAAAHAQEIAPPPDAEPGPAALAGDTRSYTPADFARFSPTTALDMLAQVPGFTIRGEDNRRGLGEATGNVLINGQRPSGKSNDAVTELSRISAADVVRIDIKDGATLNIAGLTGQVADVIVKSGGLSGTFSANPQYRPRGSNLQPTDGEASLSGEVARTRFTLAARNRAFAQGNDGPERVTGPGGALIDTRAEELAVVGNDPRLSLSLKRGQTGGTLATLNASVKRQNRRVSEISLRNGPGRPDRDRRLAERRREDSYEVGGDYNFALGGGRLKLIGLRTGERQTYTQEVTERTTARTTGDRFVQQERGAESIARAEYRWSAGGGDWQISAEGALNSLSVDNALENDVFVAIPLTGGDGAVRERRGEVIASYGRPLAPKLTVQLSAGAELSRISQSGAGGLTRQFLRPKGSAALAWAASKRLDVSAKLEREVGQLNFGDFVASANISAGTENAGNPNLVPPQSWNAEAQATRRFGPLGTATLKLYAERITDIVDVVPIGLTGQAPGNLPRATVSGLEFNGTLNLDPLGVRGAKIDASGQFQTSALDDPVTGIRRPISNDFRSFVNIQGRHDLPGTSWAYGGGYDAFRSRPGFRLDQRSLQINRGGNLQLFVENKDVFGLTVRGSAGNLLGTDEIFERSFFDRRRTGTPLFTERRVRQFGPVFTLGVSGRF